MKNPFENVRAVLFDLDGTLVETNIDFPLMRREMLAIGERYGIAAEDLQGRDILAMVDAIVAHLSLDSREDEAQRVREEAYRRLEEIEMAHCHETRVIPGAVELVNALRAADIKVGVVTRNCRSSVLHSLDVCGISPDVLLTRDDVPRPKPHPDHLQQAMELLGTTPEQTVMIGDHWMDVQGGKAAHTRTIGFLHPDRPAEFFQVSPPDLVINDLRELLPYAERLKK